MIQKIVGIFILMGLGGGTYWIAEATGNSDSEAAVATANSEDDLILNDLASLKSKLEEQKRRLEMREKDLEAREKLIQEQLTELKQLRDDFEKNRSSKVVQDEAKIVKIVETLEKMSPKSSSKMIAEMDENLAIEIFGRLSADKLAKVLGQLDPVKAGKLGEKYAGMSKSSKKEPRP